MRLEHDSQLLRLTESIWLSFLQLVESMKTILNSNALPVYDKFEAEGVDSDEWVSLSKRIHLFYQFGYYANCFFSRMTDLY